MSWLILLVALISVGCGAFTNQAAGTLSPGNFFEVDRSAAWAGDEITLSWNINSANPVAVEVWGFASYIAPQVQRVAKYPNLSASGTQVITMPGFPSAAYLIVDQSIPPEQQPNRVIELNPQFYQPQLDLFTASQTCIMPDDKLVINWATDAVFPLSFQTDVVIQTPTSIYVDQQHSLGQQFENLPADGSLTLTIPEYEPELVRMSFNFYYHNNDYTGFIGQIVVDMGQC